MNNHFDQVFVKTEQNDLLFEETESSVQNYNSSNSLINLNENHIKNKDATFINSEPNIKSEPHDVPTPENYYLSSYCQVEMDESNNKTEYLNRKDETSSHFLDIRTEFKEKNLSASYSPKTKTPKRNRKVIDLDTKLKIVRAHENGIKVGQIAKEVNFNQSTISTILKEKEKIKEVGKTVMGKNVIMMTKRRDRAVLEMEELLQTWIIDSANKRNHLSKNMIQKKAKSIFDTLKDGKEKFSASNGWFYNFQKRYGLHHIKPMVDIGSTINFKTEFQQLIKNEAYLPEQVFNIDETSLSWKMLPEGTYVHEQIKATYRFNFENDRVTLLLGGNLAGFKLKPYLIGQEEKPKATLPVYYKSNTKPWMTSKLFEDWFSNCFVPEVEEYCKNKHLNFKILLLLDNASVHLPNILTQLNENIKVVFIPPNTNSIIQPMEQGAITAFKAHFIRLVFANAILANEKGQSLVEFWIKYSLLDAIKNIDYAWKDVSGNCMTGVWKKIMDSNLNGFQISDEDIIPHVINLGHRLNFALSYDYIEYIINEEYKSSPEDLLDLMVKEKEEEKRFKIDEVASFSSQVPPSIGIYEEISADLSKVYSVLRTRDNDIVRRERVIQKIEKLVSCYKKS